MRRCNDAEGVVKNSGAKVAKMRRCDDAEGVVKNSGAEVAKERVSISLDSQSHEDAMMR